MGQHCPAPKPPGLGGNSPETSCGGRYRSRAFSCDMDASDSILLGIVSSLIATPIFLCLAYVFNKVLLPWFRQQVYRGVRINGEWRWHEPLAAPDQQTVIFSFGQAADTLRGQETVISQIQGQMTISLYRITGFISDGRVVGYTRPLDASSTNYGTFYLNFCDTVHGAELRGSLTSYDAQGHLHSMSVVFQRVSSPGQIHD